MRCEEPIRAEHRMPGTAETLGMVRALLREELAGHLTPDELEAALVAVTELATNALRHSRSGAPGGEYGLVALVMSSVTHLEVVDAGSDGDPVIRPLTETESCGRGLAMLDVMGRVSWSGGPSGHRVCVDLPRGGAR